MEDPKKLREFLEKESGFSYDTEIPEEIFEECSEALNPTDRTVVTEMYPDAVSYRDSKKRTSVHLTDFRGVERDSKASNVIVAHLEHFNPEYHPILHAVVDTPLWFLRNRILDRNKL